MLDIKLKTESLHGNKFNVKYSILVADKTNAYTDLYGCTTIK